MVSMARGRVIRAAPSGLGDLGRTDWDDADYRPQHDLAAEGVAAVCDSAIVAADHLPERLAVPVFPFDGDGFVRVQVQLVRCEQSLVAVGFTSRGLLVERLGEFQPWLGIPSTSLLALLNGSAIGGLVIDPSSAQVDAVWTKEALVALQEINDVRL